MALAALLTTACNKDEVILDDRDHAPVITLDSESGVYTVKTGRELTIAPTVEYAEGATYSWIVDGKLAGSEPTYTAVFTELGEVYITFRVETAAGKAEAELRVDVLELTPPVISLALPAEGLKVLPGVEYTFAPDIQHSDQEDFRCRWLCAGEVVSTQMSYTFREETVGSYPIRIEASNDDGTSVKEFVVEVVEKMPSEVRFEKLSHYCKTTDRSTFVGRAVYLAPSLAYVADPQFAWSVDGEPVSRHDALELVDFFQRRHKRVGTGRFVTQIHERRKALQHVIAFLQLFKVNVQVIAGKTFRSARIFRLAQLAEGIAVQIPDFHTKSPFIVFPADAAVLPASWRGWPRRRSR